jgi:hypothetical protein
LYVPVAAQSEVIVLQPCNALFTYPCRGYYNNELVVWDAGWGYGGWGVWIDWDEWHRGRRDRRHYCKDGKQVAVVEGGAKIDKPDEYFRNVMDHVRATGQPVYIRDGHVVDGGEHTPGNGEHIRGGRIIVRHSPEPGPRGRVGGGSGARNNGGGAHPSGSGHK